MDQQPNGRPAPTPEEIARLEAEAVRALQAREEAREETPAPAADWSDVPYVDDAPAPAKDDEADDDYVPTGMEKRIAAIPEDRWNLYTTLAGAALGLAAIGLLVLGGEDLGTWSLVLAAVLALIAARSAEPSWRRPVLRLRTAMLVAMLVALAVVFVVTGAQNGFRLFERK